MDFFDKFKELLPDFFGKKKVAGVKGEKPEIEAIVREMLFHLESHHKETYHHSRRVAVYSVLMGKGLGIKGEDLGTLYYGSLLHDIGKLEVDADILHNRRNLWQKILGEPAALSEEQIQEIRNHSFTGYNLLVERGFKEAVAEIALYHHGNKGGYPEQKLLESIEKDDMLLSIGALSTLAQEDGYIPPLHEIVAVADTFDAITGHRDYQKQGSVEEGLEILQEGKDKKYCAVCVDTLAEVLDDNKDLVEALQLYSLTEPLEFFS